jgi:outer membrane protein OmpA-like peptidoglycan-associated protein
VAGILQSYPDLRIQVEGHTDNIGETEFHQQLSEQRAASVRNFLVEQGVRPEIIESRAWNERASGFQFHGSGAAIKSPR